MDTLSRLLDHLRCLLPVDAAAFVPVTGDSVGAAQGWFAHEDLRELVESRTAGRFARGRATLAELALEHGEPLLLERLEAEVTGHGEEGAPERYARATCIACPVRTDPVADPLGVLVVVASNQARPLDREHLQIVEALADLAGVGLERAGLLEAEGRRAMREQQLGRAAEAVSASLELTTVYHQVVQQACVLTGASSALLTRLDARRGRLRTEAQADFSDGLAAGELALDSGTFGRVARTREPLLRPAGEAGTLMHAPIELGPRLYGVLTVAHERPDRFGPDELDLLVKLAHSSAAAVANAIDFERERRLARALTQGFVPESLPELPGYETGLLYAPAANEPTGGDVYGAWSVNGGAEMAVLIGDVAGKGVETAALSAMVRFFVEARTWDSTSPAEVLEQANRMLMGRLPRDSFVTALLGVLSPGSLRYCNAGHMPPLLVRDGAAQSLEHHGLPLGVDDAPSYGESELRLEAHDLVFAYTDGLVEARRAGRVYGVERLSAFVSDAAPRLPAGDLVRAAHDEVSGWADGLSDDVVALALRRAG